MSEIKVFYKTEPIIENGVLYWLDEAIKETLKAKGYKLGREGYGLTEVRYLCFKKNDVA